MLLSWCICAHMKEVRSHCFTSAVFHFVVSRPRASHWLWNTQILLLSLPFLSAKTKEKAKTTSIHVKIHLNCTTLQITLYILKALLKITKFCSFIFSFPISPLKTICWNTQSFFKQASVDGSKYLNSVFCQILCQHELPGSFPWGSQPQKCTRPLMLGNKRKLI